MKNQQCAFEQEVIEACASDDWTHRVRDHVAGCSMCRETRILATGMRHYARSFGEPLLPGYQLLWLKAQYARRPPRPR